jgi:hypothetical protein
MPVCNASGRNNDLLSKNNMITSLHLDEISCIGNIGILICMIMGFRILAYLALRYVPSNAARK